MASAVMSRRDGPVGDSPGINSAALAMERGGIRDWKMDYQPRRDGMRPVGASVM